MSSVATNEQYYFAFNDYMKTHNLTQAVVDGKINIGSKIVPVNFDMFFGFLVDKIVLQVVNSNAFIDKLDFLYKDTYMDVGAIIEDIRTILKSKIYDYDTKNFETDVENPYKKHKKGISVVFHRITDYKKIVVTVSYAQLKTGCLTDGGINDIVMQMINDVQVEYSAWAYAAKKTALTLPDYVQTVYVDDYKDFNIKLKDVKIDVTNYDDSYKHNAALLYTPTAENNLVIVMSERYKNKVDINVFTGLFNVSYAELKDRITYIDQFDDPKIVCGIYDKRGFQFRKALDTARELENGADLSRNRWLHFWRMHSVSPHYTAVIFKENEYNGNQPIYYSDEAVIVKGYDVDSKSFVDTYTLTIKAGTSVTVDGGTPQDITTNKDVVITNPKKLQVVTVKVFDNDINIMNYRVRFEYPADIDATMGAK